jgi:hypothetical protein
MSYVITAPEIMTAAATDLTTIGSRLDAAHSAAAPALSVVSAAADEVSVGIAQLFTQHAQGYQALARHAAAFQGQFAQNLKTSAASYTSIEDAIASLLQGLQSSVGSFGTAVAAQIVRFDTALEQLFTSLLGKLLAVSFVVFSFPLLPLHILFIWSNRLLDRVYSRRIRWVGEICGRRLFHQRAGMHTVTKGFAKPVEFGVS